MSVAFASGKKALGLCDVCGFQYHLPKLRPVTVKGVVTQLLACRRCWDKDHPQLMLGSFPVFDPQALRNPRPDNTTAESRDTQWGWAPVGGARGEAAALTPNALVTECFIGTVTVEVT